MSVYFLIQRRDISDERPPTPETDSSLLLDIMIRDGDFTKGFYLNMI